ncbi:MMPL family transporter [Dactylosporangium sucinum]|uniref:MMPL family transporter n=1 Tax=Dactylosporangium sucinum TaxID=1424081 RepID=UPI001E3EA4CD|nr:MMPL family transporter [Dactylosporangium sucinum]
MSKWIVLALWLGGVIALSPVAARLGDHQQNDSAAWLPHSAEATRHYERAKTAFPGSEAVPAVLVYSRDGGLTSADTDKINDDRDAVARWAQDRQVSDVITSDDRKAALFSLPVAAAPGDDAALADALKHVREVVEANPPAGLAVHITGPAGASADLDEAFAGLDTTVLLITIIAVAVILLLTYRSPVLWIVPLLAVGLANQVATAVVDLLAEHAGIVVNGQSAQILTVLVFGTGTDYALLLIARYREELRRNDDRHKAMRIAWRAVLPAVLASAGTIIVSLMCLLATEMNPTRALGPIGAAAVGAAMLAMLTLLPAVLLVLGRWVFWPRVPRFNPGAVGREATEDHGVWTRIARGAGRRPALIWVFTAIALAALSLGTLGLRTGLTLSDIYVKEVGSIEGQRIVAAHFPPGESSPATVIARADRIYAVVAAARIDGVATVGPPERSADGQWAQFSAILSDPPDSRAAERTIERLRTAVHGVPGADALVGGATATQLDTRVAADRDNYLGIPLVLGVIFLVLILLLRALVAPLLLTLSVALSYLAGMGIASLVFQAIGHPRIDPSMLLIGFVFLSALGVDYTIFLVTRTREEAVRLGHREGAQYALAVTGGVITSAGLVLAATFSVLTVIPLVSPLQLGTIVAVGVLLDTLIVRTLLIPALTMSVGPAFWWPSKVTKPRPTPRPADRVVA